MRKGYSTMVLPPLAAAALAALAGCTLPQRLDTPTPAAPAASPAPPPAAVPPPVRSAEPGPAAAGPRAIGAPAAMLEAPTARRPDTRAPADAARPPVTPAIPRPAVRSDGSSPLIALPSPAGRAPAATVTRAAPPPAVLDRTARPEAVSAPPPTREPPPAPAGAATLSAAPAPALAPPPAVIANAEPAPPPPDSPRPPEPQGPRNDSRYAMGMPLPNLPVAAPPAGAAVGTTAEAAADTAAETWALPDGDAVAVLARIRNRTGLGDQDLKRLQILEQQWHAGDSEALPALQAMDAELAQAVLLYTVKPGDHIWSIAARTDIYGNRSLWPLIWNANREALPAPDRLRVGQPLRIPLHPTADEAANALGWARAHAPTA